MKKLVVLGDIGVGGERGFIFDCNGICPSESATQYKDAIKYLEIRKITKGVDKVNDCNTIAKSRAEQSRAEQSRAEQSRAEQSRAEQKNAA